MKWKCFSFNLWKYRKDVVRNFRKLSFSIFQNENFLLLVMMMMLFSLLPYCLAYVIPSGGSHWVYRFNLIFSFKPINHTASQIVGSLPAEVQMERQEQDGRDAENRETVSIPSYVWQTKGIQYWIWGKIGKNKKKNENRMENPKI